MFTNVQLKDNVFDQDAIISIVIPARIQIQKFKPPDSSIVLFILVP